MNTLVMEEMVASSVMLAGAPFAASAAGLAGLAVAEMVALAAIAA